MRKEQYRYTWSDESYTYPSFIYPIIEHIEKFRKRKNIWKEDLTIWLPFDTKENIKYKDFEIEKSFYYDILKKEWYKIIVTHIATWEDFLNYEPEENFDLIIWNPPFKNKKYFFERVLEFKKPFALVWPASWLNDGWPYDLFRDKELQLFIPKTRAKFFRNWKVIWNQPSFKAVYFCLDFLEKDIMWFELDKSVDNL